MRDDEPAPDSATLEIEVRHDHGDYVIELAGELDLGSTDVLEQALGEAETGDADSILIDLEGLRFIDSTGLRTLLAAKRRADTAAYRLRLTRGQGYVADMFRLTALDRTLPFK